MQETENDSFVLELKIFLFEKIEFVFHDFDDQRINNF